MCIDCRYHPILCEQSKISKLVIRYEIFNLKITVLKYLDIYIYIYDLLVEIFTRTSNTL